MIFEGTKNQFFFGLELTRAGTSEPNTTNLIALSRLYKIEAVDLLECIQEKEPV